METVRTVVTRSKIVIIQVLSAVLVRLAVFAGLTSKVRLKIVIIQVLSVA